MDNPQYTFLLPAYKAKYFDLALNSIKNQTFTNFKVLVSDDFSPENLKSIFDRVTSGDSRFEYRRNTNNIGSVNLVHHWNLLVQMCHTEYLIMASDDDVYSPDFLSQIDALTKKYPKVDLFRARVSSINENGVVKFSDVNYEEFVDQYSFCSDMFCKATIHCIPNFVFRTKALINNGGFVNLPLAWFADDATVLLNSVNGVVNSQNTLFSFRSSGINISNSNFGNKKGEQKKVKAAQLFLELVMTKFFTTKSIKRKINNSLYENSINGLRQWVKNDIYAHKQSLTFWSQSQLFVWLLRYRFITGVRTCYYFWK